MSFFAHQNREALRATWRSAWQRHCAHAPLEPLQAQIAAVIAAHPEYHEFIGAVAVAPQEFGHGERENPFLHLSLHLALREQLGTDRPEGIAAVHKRLAARYNSTHEAEHRMIEVLATILWDAQRSGRAPDEPQYLELLHRL